MTNNSSNYNKSNPGCMSNMVKSIQEADAKKISNVFRVLNILSGALVIVSGVVTFLQVAACSSDKNCPAASFTMLGIYSVIFGILLLVFELRFGMASNWIFKNFGFMFSNRSKAIFLFFMATLCFSVIETNISALWIVSMVIGILIALNAIFMCTAVCCNPTFDEYTKAHVKTLASRSELTTTQTNNQNVAPPPTFVHTHSQPPMQGGGYAYGDAQTGGAAYGTNYYTEPGQPSRSMPFSSTEIGSQEQRENPFAAV